MTQNPSSCVFLPQQSVEVGQSQVRMNPVAEKSLWLVWTIQVIGRRNRLWNRDRWTFYLIGPLSLRVSVRCGYVFKRWGTQIRFVKDGIPVAGRKFTERSANGSPPFAPRKFELWQDMGPMQVCRTSNGRNVGTCPSKTTGQFTLVKMDRAHSNGLSNQDTHTIIQSLEFSVRPQDEKGQQESQHA